MAECPADTSCHMLQQLGGYIHLLFGQFIDLRIVDRILQLVALDRLFQGGRERQIHHKRVADASFLFQYTMIGIELHGL